MTEDEIKLKDKAETAADRQRSARALTVGETPNRDQLFILAFWLREASVTLTRLYLIRHAIPDGNFEAVCCCTALLDRFAHLSDLGAEAMASVPAGLLETERGALLSELYDINTALCLGNFGHAVELTQRLYDRQLDLADPIEIPEPPNLER
ncbi:MAG: hypothetical protein Alpg2KO_00090 [Alphaproteobacteria bacterium]